MAGRKPCRKARNTHSTKSASQRTGPAGLAVTAVAGALTLAVTAPEATAGVPPSVLLAASETPGTMTSDLSSLFSPGDLLGS